MYILFLKFLLSGFFFNSVVWGFSQSLLAVGLLTQVQSQFMWFVVSEVSTQTVLSPLHVFCALFLFTAAATGYVYNATIGIFFLGLFWAKSYIGQAWSWDYVELISLMLLWLTGVATHGSKATKTILALCFLCQVRLFDISSFHIARADYISVAGLGAKYSYMGSSPCFVFFHKPVFFATLWSFRAKSRLDVKAFFEHCFFLVFFVFFTFRLF